MRLPRPPTDMRRLAPYTAPLLLALHPVLFLYSHNAGTVELGDAWRALGCAALLGALLLGCGLAAFRDADKACLVAAAVLLLLFAYRPVAWLCEGTLSEVTDLRSAYVIVGLTLLVQVAVILAATRRDLAPLSRVLFAVAVSLFGMTAAALAVNLTTGGAAAEVAREAAAGPSAPGARRPDIYYVVLDGYGRRDVLGEYYGFDNSELVAGLERHGFFVAASSRSNYSQTKLSLASSLNMMHLDEVAEGPHSGDADATLDLLVRDSLVVEALKARGYRFVTTPSGYGLTERMQGVDVEAGRPRVAINEFESMVLDATPVGALLRPVFRGDLDAFERHRRRVDAAFDALGDLPASSEPRFVFAHVLAPHPPFVFDRHGRLPRQYYNYFTRIDGRAALGRSDLYRRDYAEQAMYLNGRVLEAVGAILARYAPDDRPIVVIQGDHGPASYYRGDGRDPRYLRERMAILNAYYVPPDLRCDLDDAITPVNTFRVLFDAAFGTRLGRLPDLCRFSTYEAKLEFLSVEETGRAVDAAGREVVPAADRP